MKSNQKKESGSNNLTNSKKENSPSKKPSVTSGDNNNNEGKEFKGEGHGHNYSVPIAGEDGGTEDQSGNHGKKSSKIPGKTAGRKSSI